MDSSAPFLLFCSLRRVGDMNGRPFISYISPRVFPLMTTFPTAFSPLSEQQPAEIRPVSMEVTWPVTAGLGVRVLIFLTPIRRKKLSSDDHPFRSNVTPCVCYPSLNKHHQNDYLDTFISNQHG
ncbi:hypothetical protein AVEN_98110-1 [Araneus ventricosus]|uniref:Uncharacterized protein n=1 Tax=Araneus ventricosus TaxID=182803 RepID=A0A4Y2HFK4_ARAVE|nr:hypothetical protein AVEN_98110-1 [Araneus ventricosus]